MKDNRPILLVEDDEIDQDAVRRAFSQLKIEKTLHTASNGEEGLAHLRDESAARPSLVLLDLNMPRMNGIEFLEAIKSDGSLRRIPVVVFTTSREGADMLRSFDLGVAGYIQKPANPDRLTEVIRTIDLYWSLNELPE